MHRAVAHLPLRHFFQVKTRYVFQRVFESRLCLQVIIRIIRRGTKHRLAFRLSIKTHSWNVVLAGGFVKVRLLPRVIDESLIVPVHNVNQLLGRSFLNVVDFLDLTFGNKLLY